MKSRKRKGRTTHWGMRTPEKKIETLCGKIGGPLSAFNEYGFLTTDAKLVTCKTCLRLL